MEQFTEHQIQAWMTTTTFMQPSFVGGEKPPPTKLEAFIAELLANDVAASDIFRAAQASNPWKHRPEKYVDFAAEIAQIIRRSDA